MAGTPQAEVHIDADLVARLLAEQHPDLAALPLAQVDAGWDNAMFRLGDDLAVRMPRRAIAAPLLAHEQRWLPRIAAALTLPAPVPLRIGEPGHGYPWRWSIVPWLSGATADERPLDASQAPIFAAFLRSLHRPAPADAPPNPFRGGPLAERAPFAEERLDRLAHRTELITPQIRRLWERALAALIDVPPVWLHGDIHPRNVLIEDGVITGVIDWGDMTAGDPATDLASIWMFFDTPEARRDVFAAYGGCSEATLLRAQGWAIHLGAAHLDAGLVDHPQHARIGAWALRRVAEDAG